MICQPRLRFRRSGKALSWELSWWLRRALFSILALFVLLTPNFAQISQTFSSLELPKELASLPWETIFSLQSQLLTAQTQKLSSLTKLADAQALRLGSLESSLPRLELRLSDSEKAQAILSSDLKTSQTALESSQQDLATTKDSLKKSNDELKILKAKMDRADVAEDVLKKDYESRLAIERLKSSAFRIGFYVAGGYAVVDLALELTVGKGIVQLIKSGL
jgi:hypothetical protein